MLQLFVFCAVLSISWGKVCDVTQYGAVGDGAHNDTSALQAALDGCASSPSSTVLFPGEKVYLSWPLRFSGGKGVVLQVDGRIESQGDPDLYPSSLPPFFSILDGSGVQLRGAGGIDGNGSAWWSIRKKDPAHRAPYLVAVKGCDGFLAQDVTLSNSPKFHMVLEDTVDSVVDGVRVQAPGDSPNTDAFDPGSGVRNLTIRNVNVSNGDDGVAIKPGASGVVVEDSVFYFGHGTSIGSVGEDNSMGSVSDILVQRVTFFSTSNAARVKTWQNGSGTVRNIVYRDIVVHSVDEPIRINQFYCPHSQHPLPCQNSSIAVNISDVTFQNISGTHAGPIAGSLYCSDASPCANITLLDISLYAAAQTKHPPPTSRPQPLAPPPSYFTCWQAFGTATNVTPHSCLWGPSPPTTH